MSRHRGSQIRMVGMPYNNMPSAFDDVKAIGAIQTSKVVLSPTKGRLTHTGYKFMFSYHKGKLSIEQQTGAIRSRHLVLADATDIYLACCGSCTTIGMAPPRVGSACGPPSILRPKASTVGMSASVAGGIHCLRCKAAVP